LLLVGQGKRQRRKAGKTLQEIIIMRNKVGRSQKTRDGIDDIYALETADSEKNEYDNVEDAFDEDSAVNDHYDFSSHYKDGSVSDSDDELDFEGSLLRLPVNLNILF